MNDAEIKLIRKLIANAEFEQVFSLIQNSSLDRNQKNTILQLKRRNSTNTKNWRANLITYEEYSREHSRITEALSSAVSKLESKNIKKARTHKYKNRLVLLIFLFLVVVVLFTLQSNLFRISIANNKKVHPFLYKVLIIPFEGNINKSIEQNIQVRLNQFSRDNEMRIDCDIGNEIMDFDYSYETAYSLGKNSNSQIVLFGLSEYLSTEDSVFIRLNYQSIVDRTLYSRNSIDSDFKIKYAHEILSGELTGKPEEVIRRTYVLLMLQDRLNDPYESMNFINREINRYPEDDFLLMLKANLYLWRGNYQVAYDLYERVAIRDTTMISAFQNLAVLSKRHLQDEVKSHEWYLEFVKFSTSSKLPTFDEYEELKKLNPGVFVSKHNFDIKTRTDLPKDSIARFTASTLIIYDTTFLRDNTSFFDDVKAFYPETSYSGYSVGEPLLNNSEGSLFNRENPITRINTHIKVPENGSVHIDSILIYELNTKTKVDNSKTYFRMDKDLSPDYIEMNSDVDIELYFQHELVNGNNRFLVQIYYQFFPYFVDEIGGTSFRKGFVDAIRVKIPNVVTSIEFEIIN